MSASGRTEALRKRLTEAFAPLELDIVDESRLHAGHPGAAGGAGHFRIRIVAEAFRGKPALARHRLVYAALADLMKSEVHALAIDARPPDLS